MPTRPALALIDCDDRALAAALPEAVALARHLARAHVRSMMAAEIEESAPRE